MEGHFLLHAVQDRDPAGMQRPIEIRRFDRFAAGGERAVGGEERLQLLEHGGDGFEGQDRDFLRQGGAEAGRVGHELQFLGRVRHGRRLPVDEGVDGFVLGARGEFVAEDEGGGAVGEEDGGDFRLFRVLDHFLEVAAHVDAADFAGEYEDSGRAVAHGRGLGHGCCRTHGRESAGTANAVEERPVGFGPQAEFLGHEEVEAGITGVGAGHCDDVGDISGCGAGLTHGFFACLDG